MNNFFRALIAGYGAKKLGGGCLGTVVVFIIIWVALGQCSWTKKNDDPQNNSRQLVPDERRASISYHEAFGTCSIRTTTNICGIDAYGPCTPSFLIPLRAA